MPAPKNASSKSKSQTNDKVSNDVSRNSVSEDESVKVKPRSKVQASQPVEDVSTSVSTTVPMEPPKKQPTRRGQAKKQVAEESSQQVDDDIVPVDDVIQETLTEAQSSTTTRKPRVMVSRETVVEDGTQLLAMVDEELERLGDSKDQSTKFLRQLQKRLRTYTTNVSKVVKKREPVKRTANSNSGFLKKVRVSDDVRSFTGWKGNDLYSRTDVTKFICAYIKEHNLQNKENGRYIHPDKKLGSLLRYDGSSPEGIRYCDIQKMLKPHFQNPE